MVRDHEGCRGPRPAAARLRGRARGGCRREALRWRERPAPGRAGRGRPARARGRGARGRRAQAGRRDPAQGLGAFRPGGARPRACAVIASPSTTTRASRGLEPIRRLLPIAPRACRARGEAARRRGGAIAAAPRPAPGARQRCARRSTPAPKTIRRPFISTISMRPASGAGCAMPDAGAAGGSGATITGAKLGARPSPSSSRPSSCSRCHLVSSVRKTRAVLPERAPANPAHSSRAGTPAAHMPSSRGSPSSSGSSAGAPSAERSSVESGASGSASRLRTTQRSSSDARVIAT